MRYNVHSGAGGGGGHGPAVSAGVGGEIEERCREAVVRYLTRGRELMDTKTEGLKEMSIALEEAEANFEFRDMRLEMRRWEFHMEKAVTRHFVGVKEGNGDDDRHIVRESEALRRKFEAEKESLRAWMLLNEHRAAVKAMRDALVQLARHMDFWHRNVDKLVHDLVRETAGTGGPTLHAIRDARLVCDCGSPSCRFPFTVDERQALK